jgi:glycosyltransferase involved in cell wall biosynthesis
MTETHTSLPRFSVVMPTYSRQDLLHRSIGSVQSQTFGNWELIVVDDGSTDETRRVVLEMGDPRTSYVWQENSGVSAARNHGISLARGEYIAFLDDDDEYLPEHLAVLDRELRARGDPECLAYTLAYRSEGGERFPVETPVGSRESPIVLGANPATPSIAIHRSILRNYRFDVTIKCHEDAELWGRIALAAPVVRVESRTVLLHVHAGERLSEGLDVGGLLEMRRTYDYIDATRSRRVAIPRSAMRRKRRSIELGLAYRYGTEARRLQALRSLLRILRVDPRVVRDHRFWTAVRLLNPVRHHSRRDAEQQSGEIGTVREPV